MQTGDFSVKVHGTKFNISTYADSPRSVTLVEGSVSLQPVGERETFLSPGEQAVYSEDGTFTTRTVDVNRVTCWKNGYLKFSKTPMTECYNRLAIL